MKYLLSQTVLTTLLASLLVSCATPIVEDPKAYYIAPQPSENTASIMGESKDFWGGLGTEIAYIFAVDFKKIKNGEKKLKEPVILEAGEHKLQFWCAKGGYRHTNLATVNIEAGKQYQIDFEIKDTCYVWLYDFKTKRPIGKLITTVELPQHSFPERQQPIDEMLKPRPKNIVSTYTVPIYIP